MHDDELYAPFWIHVEELRLTLFKILGIVLIGVVISFCCYQPLIAWLTLPLKNFTFLEERLEYVSVSNNQSFPQLFVLPKQAEALKISPGTQQIDTVTYQLPPEGSLVFAKKIPALPLVILGPLEGMLVAFKVSIWTGLTITSPFWLYFLLQFIAPALRRKEKRLLAPFLILSLGFILMGGCLAYFITIPLANAYLSSFNSLIGHNFWSLANYLDYTFFLLLANGLAFELGIVGLFAVHLELIKAETLAKHRRGAIVAAFILGALLTPPDVLTQIMLAVPLMGLYEGIILCARLRQRAKRLSDHKLFGNADMN